MTHPTEGQIRAFLDREVTGRELDLLRGHFAACPECQDLLEAQRRAEDEAHTALLLLDQGEAPQGEGGPWDLEAARARLRARLHDRYPAAPAKGLPDAPAPTSSRRRLRAAFAPRSSRWRLRSALTLPRAASIALLLVAGGVSALPGSPVRRWMLDGWRALTGGGGQEAAAPSPAALPAGGEGGAPAAALGESGARIPASGGGVILRVRGLREGAELRVRWIEEGEAGIFAGEGTRFRSEPGTLEAEGPPGPVRVEIPRSLERLELLLEDVVVLRKTGGEIRILAPVEQRTATEIVFGSAGGAER